jgi:hypothetical protein
VEQKYHAQAGAKILEFLQSENACFGSDDRKTKKFTAFNSALSACAFDG